MDTKQALQNYISINSIGGIKGNLDNYVILHSYSTQFNHLVFTRCFSSTQKTRYYSYACFSVSDSGLVIQVFPEWLDKKVYKNK